MKIKKKIRYLFALSGILTLLLSFSLLNASEAKKSKFEKLELFNKILFLIENQYYRKIDIKLLIEGAVRGMMSALDPHSAFLNKKIFKKIKEDTSGEFGGLGIEVTQKDGVLIVTTPIEDTPAFRAGIKSGDKIMEINGESTIGLSLEEAIHKMRGKRGGKIRLGISREDSEILKYFTLKRETIRISAVKSQMIDKKYIYIRLTQFQKKSTKQIVEVIKKYRKKNSSPKGLVLDLRSNPGGLLEEAVNLVSVFVKEGTVVSTEGRDPKHKEIHYVKKIGHKELKIPIIILVNGASASASEIVAGALQDFRRALIMGSQTFGKGSVQSVVKLDSQRGIKLTVAQYMTPRGRKIQAIGIKPDILIDDYEGVWVKENRKESEFIREVDLRNHLTAVVETKEEKKARLKREKRARQKRVKKMEFIRKEKKNLEMIPKRFDPTSDYQVIQAVNYLKSFNLMKKLK